MYERSKWWTRRHHPHQCNFGRGHFNNKFSTLIVSNGHVQAKVLEFVDSYQQWLKKVVICGGGKGDPSKLHGVKRTCLCNLIYFHLSNSNNLGAIFAMIDVLFAIHLWNLKLFEELFGRSYKKLGKGPWLEIASKLERFCVAKCHAQN